MISSSAATPANADTAEPLLVGQKLYGFCHGFFGRDSYDTKTVEAVGVDWVVVRDSRGDVLLATGDNIHAHLADCTTASNED